jgi:hypothetical protein
MQIGYTAAWAPSDKPALERIFHRYGGRAADWWDATGKRIYPEQYVDYVESIRPRAG